MLPALGEDSGGAGVPQGQVKNLEECARVGVAVWAKETGFVWMKQQ